MCLTHTRTPSCSLRVGHPPSCVALCRLLPGTRRSPPAFQPTHPPMPTCAPPSAGSIIAAHVAHGFAQTAPARLNFQLDLHVCLLSECLSSVVVSPCARRAGIPCQHLVAESCNCPSRAVHRCVGPVTGTFLEYRPRRAGVWCEMPADRRRRRCPPPQVRAMMSSCPPTPTDIVYPRLLVPLAYPAQVKTPKVQRWLPQALHRFPRSSRTSALCAGLLLSSEAPPAPPESCARPPKSSGNLAPAPPCRRRRRSVSDRRRSPRRQLGPRLPPRHHVFYS